MGKRKNLDQLIADMGYPPEVEQAIRDDVKDRNTAERIVSGELQLPSVTDAVNHHERMEAEAGRRRLNAADADTVKALQDRLAALEAKLPTQPAADPAEPDEFATGPVADKGGA